MTILECDVSSEESIKAFTEQVRRLGRKGCVLERGVVDVVVLNAGVLVCFLCVRILKVGHLN